MIPAGTYTATSIAVPDGVTLQGAGMDTTWLKGKVTYGSNDVIEDLKLGDLGYSVSQPRLAHRTRCSSATVPGRRRHWQQRTVVISGT